MCLMVILLDLLLILTYFKYISILIAPTRLIELSVVYKKILYIFLNVTFIQILMTCCTFKKSLTFEPSLSVLLCQTNI